MSQRYFVKFTPGINKVIGCQRAALIFGCLEYWSVKKPEGFYKFIEPCAHRLYREGDSWTEELNCDPKSFAKSFQKIGVKYISRTEFEKAQDKFQGKFYASYYDRYTNRTFFIRNHEAVAAFLSIFSPKPKNSPKTRGEDASRPADSQGKFPTSIGKSSRSYRGAKNASNGLSEDKSHANNETAQKMIGIWITAIEGGKRQIELTGRRIAFLRQALKDKFDQSLEKWEAFCQKIASSKFLMGEKTSFKATLDWALKFDNIQKILEGDYGIGDRNPSPLPSNAEIYAKNLKVEKEAMEGDIINLPDESDPVKAFRLKALNKIGVKDYHDYLKDCGIEACKDDVLTLRPSTRYKAKFIASLLSLCLVSDLLSDSPFRRINILQQDGEFLFDKWFGVEQGRELERPSGLQIEKQDERSLILPAVFQPEEKSDIPTLETSPPILAAGSLEKTQRPDTSNPAVLQEKFPFSIGKISRSYIDAKNTSNDLSKDKSHAGNKTAQKMIGVWNTAMGNGKQQTGLTGQRVAWLNRAWEDKFDQSLEKQEEYCQKIASSKVLEGEKTSFKATLDWALKFENAEKILEGDYGMDKIPTDSPKNNAAEFPIIREGVVKLDEPDEVKDFRVACPERLRAAIYQSWFQKLSIERDGGRGITLIASTRFHADCMGVRYQTDIKNILVSLGFGKSLAISVVGEAKKNLALEAGKASQSHSGQEYRWIDKQQAVHKIGKQDGHPQIVLPTVPQPEVKLDSFILEENQPVFREANYVKIQRQDTSNRAVFQQKFPFSIRKISRLYIEAKNTTNDLSKDKSNAGDEIVKKMIWIWSTVVEGGKQKIELTGKWIAFLKKALADKFDRSLEKWQEFCQKIASSKFLMGEKTSFKATLEWALKFDVTAKILSGDCYGIGDRSRKLTPGELEELEKERQERQKAKELEQQRSVQALEEEIKNRSDEPGSLRNFRIKWLRAFVEQSYREFLADSTLKIGSEATDLIIQPRERIIAIRLESHWNPEFLSDQPFKRVQVYHYIPDFMGKPLLFDRWFGDYEEVVKIEQGMEESINPANGFDGSIDERQSVETNQLRAHLKAHIPQKEYPVWLDGIKVQTIKPDGILVVTFKDKATSDYARIRFSERILKSAVELWSEVAGLIIHEESGYLSGHDENEYLETDEKTLVEQAVQSLMGACFSGGWQRAGTLDDCIPY